MITVAELLMRKAEIDKLGEGEGQFTQRFRWLSDAVQFLLELEQKRLRE